MPSNVSPKLPHLSVNCTNVVVDDTYVPFALQPIDETTIPSKVVDQSFPSDMVGVLVHTSTAPSLEP